MWLADVWELGKYASTHGAIGLKDVLSFPRVEAVSIDAMATKLAEIFGTPCNLSPIDEQMMCVCGDECPHEVEPPTEDAAACWRRWIQIYVNKEAETNE